MELSTQLIEHHFSQLSVQKFRLITFKVSCDSNSLYICMSEVPEDEWVTPEGSGFLVTSSQTETGPQMLRVGYDILQCTKHNVLGTFHTFSFPFLKHAREVFTFKEV